MTLYKWSQTAATNGAADSTCPFPEGMAASALNDGTRGMMAAVAKYRDDIAGAIVSAGTNVAYTVSSYEGFDSLLHLAGQMIAFSPHATNGGTVTLNVDSLGAKPLRSSPGVELAAGTIIQGTPYVCTYNNTDGVFYLQSFFGIVLPAGAVTATALAANAVTYAKMQSETAATLLGNPTGSGAAPSEITLGAGLAFSGTTLSATLAPTLVPGYLSGLTLSTAGSSGTFGIAAGCANESGNTNLMLLASAYTKTTSAWTVGSGAGGLDTSTIAASTWYHVFLIKRTDTGVVDVLFSLNPSAPTMPTSYTLKRRIGSMLTNISSQWTAFSQVGDQFIWATSFFDLNAGTTTAVARTLYALTVPTGITVNAMFRLSINSNGAGGNVATLITSPLESDQAAVVNGLADLVQLPAPSFASGSFNRLTNTSAQIGIRTSGAGLLAYVNTYGWSDSRGK